MNWRTCPAASSADDIFSGTPVGALASLVTLKLGPSFHRNLAAVEFTLILDSSLLHLLVRGLSSITPREIVKLPERVGGQDKVPNREGDQVDQHPDDVRPRVSSDNDKDRGETENQSKQNKRDDLHRRIDNRDNDWANVSKLERR